MKRRIWIGGLVVLGLVGWYLFRPELLFVNTKVNEQEVASVGASVTRELAAGRFHSVAHETRGTATIQDIGGRRVLRLTQFTTSNGPDVRVYLVAAADASDNETVTKAGYVELGKLKGTDGDQNYDIPAGLDLNTYRAATIWCRRFAVNFATAALTPATPATKFTITVENISRGQALKLSSGGSAPFVSAPVLWVIHEGSTNPIFVGGKPDQGLGLELLAETGNPSRLAGSLT